jgi:phosphoadenosine phosphosulfate reductase
VRGGVNLYSYTYDKQTGGLLINSSPTGFSKEPRPVYAPELDLLGFDKYWKYDKQTDNPYMWAEANVYWYRGVCVAKLKGGNLYTAPEIILSSDETGNPVHPETDGIPLKPIDIEGMVAKNREYINIIEQTTVKKILAIYTKYKDKLDCFHVAFSGGKDSCVLLDLVKKALPKGSFIVVFGDTGMEFPDTYDIINETQNMCVKEEIPFYIAKSHLKPEESWSSFGPPSRTLRWCCFVHKSAPQALKLREITGKTSFTGLAFVGVRSFESSTRSEYEYENYGRKQKGQYSHNSILEWTSAEIWLYTYTSDLIINEAYKKGSARVGCLCCPMGGGKASYLERRNYTNEANYYYEFIKNANGRQSVNSEEFLKSGGWSARKNGRDLANNPNRYKEKMEDGFLVIDIINPDSNWNEWIKTINITPSEYITSESNKGYTIKLKESVIKTKPLDGKHFKQVAHKTTCCKGCKVCEANCSNGAIQFINNNVQIRNCIKCNECHAIDSGCLLFHSIRHPHEGGKQMASLNTLSNHAPKTEWLQNFFARGNDFFENHGLGKEQKNFFTRFLKDTELVESVKRDYSVTPLFGLCKSIGWSTDVVQGLILINLTMNNPQIEWYIKKLSIGRPYLRSEVIDMLHADGVTVGKNGKPESANSICAAFKRLTETPFGNILNFGYVTDNWELVRMKCSVPDSRVILYGLFKFAEKCNDYKGFTLTTLLDETIERDGVSPTRIFGLDRDEMTPILLGLSAKYLDFISASFTHDLEKITLAEDKKSQDVLNLFMED